MIGNPVLRIVVGANFFAAIPGLDLRTPRLTQLLVSPVLLHVVQSCPQDGHRTRLVLELGALILTCDHDSGRKMCDAYRTVGRIDTLTAMATRTVHVNAQ